MRVASGDHVAQFFDDQDEFGRRVGDFIAEGVRAGEAIVLLATPERVAVIERRLLAAGIDVADLRHEPWYVVLDAETTLNEVSPDGSPNSVLFGEVVGAAVRRAIDARGRVRAYGELVSLLWSQGRRDAAVQIEQLWNELLGFHPIALLCGYAFDGSIDASGFERVAATHQRLDPPPIRRGPALDNAPA